MKEGVEQALELLNQINEDDSVPNNIKEKAKKIDKILKNSDDELRVRVDRALQILDEISEDPNIPPYTRTQIWGVASSLESIPHK